MPHTPSGDAAAPTGRLNTALAGRYRIEKQLGQGGMATVYLAQDLKHDRQVAIKVLKPELAAVLGAERFVVEIKTTAQLQHPHILPLFDSGTADGFLYYVMPYIEGETLRGKLNRETQLGIDEAVRITAQVADALDYAHRHGVIHRDIKPENILLHDGRPMVADFGIALAVSAAAGGRMTETGLSLGTPHYMSPEQATAEKEITGRSDIYSLASVLYEMLAGQPPHMGGSAQQIIMKIIAEPAGNVTQHRKAVPPNVAAALAQALEKLPADRFETAKAFAEALVNRTFTSATFVGDLSGVTGRSRVMTRPFIVAVAVALIATTAAVAGWLRPSTQRQVSRYRVVFPTDQEPVIVGQGQMAWAPDESWIVYTGPGAGGRNTQLWVKQRDRLDATPLPGTLGALAPSVSPDGRTIAFTQDNTLRSIPAGGGPTTLLADSAWPGLPALWLEDGSVAYSDAIARLRRVSAGGRPAEVLHTTAQGFGAVPAAALPSERGVLFLRCSLGCTPVSELWVLDGRSGEARQVYPEASWAQFQDGLLLYTVRDGTTYGVPFDLGTLAPSGAPIPLFAGVRVDQGASIALTPRGSMMYVAGAGRAVRSELVWVDRDGRTAPVDTGWRFIPGVNPGMALSPDGKRVAIGVREDLNSDIWVKDLPDGPVSRITRDSLIDVRPRWAPGAAHLTFLSNRTGLYQPYVTRADGIGGDSIMFRYSRAVFEAAISRDGRWEIFRVGTGQIGTDIVARQRGVDSVPRDLLAEPFGEAEPVLSPDGRWLAYVSNETGREEVFVRPFPNVNGGKWKISDGGGISPVWSHSGRELFYLDEANGFISQAVAPGATFQRGVQRKLFTVPARHTRLNAYAQFDVSPDDRRFLFIMSAGDSQPAESPALIVVENWMDEVKRIVKERAR